MGSSLGKLPKGASKSDRALSQKHLKDRQQIAQKTKEMDRRHASEHSQRAAASSNKDVKKFHLDKADAHRKNLKKVTVEAKKISTKLKGS